MKRATLILLKFTKTKYDANRITQKQEETYEEREGQRIFSGGVQRERELGVLFFIFYFSDQFFFSSTYI